MSPIFGQLYYLLRPLYLFINFIYVFIFNYILNFIHVFIFNYIYKFYSCIYFQLLNFYSVYEYINY